MTTATTHRTAGTRGGNQYGSYQVRYASAKQVSFIKNLLEQKQHNEGAINFDTLNVQGATALIKKLMSLPAKEGLVIAPTEKQISFAKRLVSDKQGGLELLNIVLADRKVNAIEQLSKGDVSLLIETLKGYETKPLAITEVGAYLYNETIYSIRLGQESKKWQVWSFNEAQKKYLRNDNLLPILKELTPANRLTLEQAVKYSAQTGICCHCGRTLTKLKSVACGMGQVCAKKYR